jgi:A/G-specific adenine glycosylase
MASVAERQRSAKAMRSGDRKSISGPLLGWYDRERRDLPWRYGPGETADPYRVWLSEIMLQQTTVKVVIPYFRNFLSLWPTVERLAAADEEDVLRAWAGLGYYSRARNLLNCARAVVEQHGGVFPRSSAELVKLPGIGPYTAAAISAIAFGEAAMPVDGNVERVVSRLFAVETPLPASKQQLRDKAATLTPAERPGDFAQAMMDLGATVCTPKRPSCLMCPIQANCEAHERGIEARLPVKSAKPDRPTRRGVAFLALSEDGSLLLRQRPDTGLLARMLEVPSTDWLEEIPDPDEALRAAPVKADWWLVPGIVTHTFTHFRLEIMVYRAMVPPSPALTFWADGPRCRWVPRRKLAREALPSVMRKVIAHGMTTH